MTKEGLIKWITELPEDIQIFSTNLDDCDCINIKVFRKPKNKEFLEWYFGP